MIKGLIIYDERTGLLFEDRTMAFDYFRMIEQGKQIARKVIINELDKRNISLPENRLEELSKELAALSYSIGSGPREEILEKMAEPFLRAWKVL
jgi:hypothetical protein